VRYRFSGMTLGVALLLMACGCAGGPSQKNIKMGPVDTGAGSLEATRRALTGTWTLASLEVVNAAGAHRAVKATGQLTYDAYGSMIIHGVVQDAALADTLVLEYAGRIVIDTTKHQFYPADLVAASPADPGQIAAISPDKARAYELVGNSFVVTYLDKAGKPTAVARWRR
jgi:hypothetical protein